MDIKMCVRLVQIELDDWVEIRYMSHFSYLTICTKDKRKIRPYKTVQSFAEFRRIIDLYRHKGWDVLIKEVIVDGVAIEGWACEQLEPAVIQEPTGEIVLIPKE